MDDDVLEERRWYTRRGFIAAAALLAAVAVLGLFLLLTGRGAGDDTNPPAATPTASAEPTNDPAPATSAPDDTTATSVPPPPPGALGDCPDLAGTDGDSAIATAPDVQWSPVGEVAAAISEDNGPAARNGIKRCFAHTPEGALLAAYNFLADARTSSLDAVEVVDARVLPTTPNLASLRSGIAGEDTNTTPITVVGYRFLQTAPDRYTVSLAQRLPGTSGPRHFLDRITVEWHEGDWWITEVADVEQIDAAPPDYILWGPQAGNTE